MIDENERTATEDEMVAAVEQAKREILEDMCTAQSSMSLKMPLDITSFSELHNYVDANTYAGLCGPLHPGEADRSGWTLGDMNELQNRVHEWLESGDAAREKVAMWLCSRYSGLAPEKSWENLDEEARDRWRNDARHLLADLLLGPNAE